MRGAHLPVLDHRADRWINRPTTEAVTHNQCDVRPAVTFPASEHRRPPFDQYHIILLGDRGTYTLAQGCYVTVERPRVKRRGLGRPSNVLTITP